MCYHGSVLRVLAIAKQSCPGNPYEAKTRQCESHDRSASPYFDHRELGILGSAKGMQDQKSNEAPVCKSKMV